jgi:DNA-binding FadR family transcriptional regulator
MEKPSTRAEKLVESIEALIDERRLVPGARLGTKEDFRQQSGFARATVNEAVRLLEDRGRIAVRPGRGGGLYVAEVSPIVRLRRTLLTAGESAPTVAEALAVREALELPVALDAARYRTLADVKDLRRFLARLEKATASTDSFMRANWALHERIAEITPNRMLKEIYVGLTRCIEELSTCADSADPSRRAEHMQARLAVHLELVEAIGAGDLGRTETAIVRHAVR